MTPVNLSNSSLKVSPLALGMWRIHTITSDELEKLLETAIDSGITTFDHADIYGGYTCEDAFGSWMKTNKHLRDQIQLVTKCGIKLISENRPTYQVKHYDTSYDHIVVSAERSLKNLESDYLDLLLIHRPDPLMDPEEVARAFSDLQSSGKVRHFGVSNFAVNQYDLLAQACDIPLITNQIEISLFHSTPMFDGSLDFLHTKGVNPMAWSPLGGANHIQEAFKLARFKEIAESYGLNEGDLLLAWLLKHPARIIPLLGTMKSHRIESAVAAFNVKLDKQDWFEMLELVRGHEVA